MSSSVENRLRAVRGRKITCVLAAAATVLVAAPAHAADSGGGTPVAAPAPVKKPQRPVVSDVRCASNPAGDCIEAHRVDQGGSITLLGSNLQSTTSVLFIGGKGKRDNQVAAVTSASETSASVIVPGRARTGPVVALTSGPRSARWTGLLVENPTEVLRPYSQSALSAPVEATVSQPRRIYVGGLHKSVFRFKLTGTQALDVQINVARQKDGAIVRVLKRERVQPGAVQRIAWDGTSDGKKPLPDGRYTFQVVTPGASPAAVTARAPASESVTLSNYVYPIRGAHDYGSAQNRFGDARPGHSHGGHDVFAKCGTPMVAARAGRVIYSGYGGAPGHYVAIDGERTGYDFVYMHLKDPPMVSRGDRVYTGQQIGFVGETGNAVGCHLHFEIWTAPGWYDGGHAIDPLPFLQRWDRPADESKKPRRR